MRLSRSRIPTFCSECTGITEGWCDGLLCNDSSTTVTWNGCTIKIDYAVIRPADAREVEDGGDTVGRRAMIAVVCLVMFVLALAAGYGAWRLLAVLLS